MTFEKQKCNITTNIIILLNLLTKPWNKTMGPSLGTKPRDQTLGPSLGTKPWDQTLGPSLGTKPCDTHLKQASGANLVIHILSKPLEQTL